MAAPPAPWQLLSPTGLVYTVRNEDALNTLADEIRVPRSNLRQLVGLNKNSYKNSSDSLPQQKGEGWQLLQQVWWIQRDACVHGPAAGPFPFVTADGDEWVRMYYHHHNDSGLDGKRLRTLAHKGSVPTKRERRPDYRGWRKVPAPADAFERGLLYHVQDSSPFAPPKVCHSPNRD